MIRQIRAMYAILAKAGGTRLGVLRHLETRNTLVNVAENLLVKPDRVAVNPPAFPGRASRAGRFGEATGITIPEMPFPGIDGPPSGSGNDTTD